MSNRPTKSEIPQKITYHESKIESEDRELLDSNSKYYKPKAQVNVDATFIQNDEIMNNLILVGQPKEGEDKDKILKMRENNPISERSESRDDYIYPKAGLGLLNVSKNRDENYIMSSKKSINNQNGIDSSVIFQRAIEKRRSTYNRGLADLTKSLIKEEEETPYEEELKFLEDFIKKETALEEEHETDQYFSKIKIDEMISFIYAFLAIGSALVYHELKTNGADYALDPNVLESAIMISILVVSASVGCFCIIILIFSDNRMFEIYKLYEIV